MAFVALINRVCLILVFTRGGNKDNGESVLFGGMNFSKERPGPLGEG